MVYLSDNELSFPSPKLAREDGLLCVGGDLGPDRLILAYRSGIFPWYEDGQPLLWWSPNPRMVLYPQEFKVSKSFRSRLRKHPFRISYDTDFEQVIRRCAQAPRKDQLGTWITQEMMDAYMELHAMGVARCVEVWDEQELVGGLYGIDLPHCGVFCGESMFSNRPDASKIALHALVVAVQQAGYDLIDCQMYTDHLRSLGAREIAREDFLKLLSAHKESFIAFSVSS